METFYSILVGIGIVVALFLFYCGGWWPRTWFRGCLFIYLSFVFTPFITFPIQWFIWKYAHTPYTSERYKDDDNPGCIDFNC